MINAEIRDKYHVAIGIECHVQLKTNTKLFSAVGNDARSAAPNSLISHIDLGMPGALPVLNQKAVELAMRIAFAFNTEPQKYSYFERKHYFYPDLPKGYQITQLNFPIIVGGSVVLEGNETRLVRLNRVQLEEDAGKSSHPAGKDYSLVDLNRAGTPLLEIVSEPDIRSAAEAKAYARELWLIVRYSDVSDGDLYHGNMRFDVNVSISEDKDQLGLRTETKNLNSFRSIEKAVIYEIERQIELKEKGQKVVQETRGWDEAKQRTFSQRSKEEAHDYRYFPEPDIPPIDLSTEDITKAKASLPIMPGTIRKNLAGLGLEQSAIETLLDEMPAGKLVTGLIEAETDPEHVRKIAYWFVGDIQAKISNGEFNWDDLKLNPDDLVSLAVMVAKGEISSTAAKTVLIQMFKNGQSPNEIAKEQNLLQLSDETELKTIVEKVIDDNPKAIADFSNGEAKALGFLVGQVMKESGGQANPSLVQNLIKQQLAK